MAGLPERTRSYQNHHLDGTRWEACRPREGDIVIATSYRAGTTWTQGIVANLLFPDQRQLFSPSAPPIFLRASSPCMVD